MALKDIFLAVFLCAIFQGIDFRSAKVALAQERDDVTRDPIIYYTTVELACSEGYPVQEHRVVTDDGYILMTHRIPSGRIRPKMSNRKNHYRKIHLKHHPDFDECVRESRNVTSTGTPVLLVHGLFMASDGWLLQGPGYDLAYILADSGYDVWMFNVRGSFYSRKHKTMSPSDPKFWDYSTHEGGTIDLPATIDYILKVTKKDKIGYVGLSMGTTIFFVLASARPEYNDKILGFAGLAPVAFIKEKHMNTRRKMLFNFLGRLLVELKKKNDVNELFPKSERLVDLGRYYCSKGYAIQLQDLCYDLVTVFLGYHSKLVLRNKFHLYVTHVPTGTSKKLAMHYLQNVKNNSFKQFDYGVKKNLERYGSKVPPDYPLWNITTPVALYYTDGDFFYDVKDIMLLRKLLPNVIDMQEQHKFNHGDYLWSFKAKDLVYPRVLSFLKQLSNQYYLQSRKKKSIPSKP